MKICVLSSFEDSMQKDSGASIRIYNLAKGLAALGHKVTVIIPSFNPTFELVEGVTVYGIKGLYPKAMLEVLQKLVNVGRPTALYFYDLLFVFRVGRLIRDADIVQIEQQTAGGLLIPFIRKCLKRSVVVDCHDIFQAIRVKHTTVLRRILETFLEKLAYKNANLLLAVSEIEKKHLLSAGFQKLEIEVVPNGVDTNSVKKSPEIAGIRNKYGLEGSRNVVFVGNLGYPPNREAIQLLSSVIAPKVLNEINDAKFLVVGKIRNKMQMSGLTFTGFVENISDILSISDVAVAPLFQGSGTRLKILEYFSCSLPVVSTSIGAEGLNVKNGVNIFVEDDLENFALRIIELLKNRHLSVSMGAAAKELAATYDWNKIARKLENGLYSLLPESQTKI